MLLVALVGDRPLTVLVNALLAIQGFHIYGLYGLGENRRSFSLNVRFGIPTYAYHEPWMQTVLACIASVAVRGCGLPAGHFGEAGARPVRRWSS